MVNEAWLFTFCHCRHGIDVNFVKNYLYYKRSWCICHDYNLGIFDFTNQSLESFSLFLENAEMDENQCTFW